MVSPATGTVSKSPQRVLTTLAGLERLEAKAGRSLKMELAVQILSQGNVEGRGGIRDDEGKELNAPRQIPTATQEEAVTHIVGGAPVILFQIVLVHGEAAAAGGVAVNITEGIKAEKRNLGAANIEIGDHLVLVVKAGGLVLIQVGEAGVGPASPGFAGSGALMFREMS